MEMGSRKIARDCVSLLLSLHLIAALITTTVGASASADDVYRDPSQPVEARVQDLLKRMTLAEKIGQMTQIERSVANDSNVWRYQIGGVFTGAGNIPTPDLLPVWQAMVDGLQQQALSTRLGIPMMFGADAVHGQSTIIGATIFPHNVGLGSSRDRDLVRRIGDATALEVRATGIPYVFAPCIATCRDPRWGRCYESYSEDTNLVRNMTDIILGLQGEPIIHGEPFVASNSKVAACAKHYVGDGGTTNGINEGNTVLSYEELVKIHMTPYFDAIDKGVSSVMISFSSWNGEQMHANEFLITKVLKQQQNFKGFVISDFQGIDKITSPPDLFNYTYCVLKGINAGIDMVMVPYVTEDFTGNLTALVEAGYIEESRIDDAVTRILRVKFLAGLFEYPYANYSYTHYFGAADHRELGREAVRKSLVLLKNEMRHGGALLPLSKVASRILVAGTHANDIGLQCGGWTIYWNGLPGNSTNGTTILQGIEKTVDPSTEVVYVRTPGIGVAAEQDVDVAIVVVGETPYAETFGDSLTLTLPADSISTIENVCTEVACVVVLITGRPVVIEPYVHLIDALVAAWLPGTEGTGIADVLFGDYDFTGKSSRTWFKSVDQLPMNFGDEHYDPLFSYGHGLQYESLGEISSQISRQENGISSSA